MQAELAVEDQPAELNIDELPSYNGNREGCTFKHDRSAESYSDVKQETEEPQSHSKDEANIDYSCDDVAQEMNVGESQVFGVPKGTLELIDLDQKRLAHSQNIPLTIELPSTAPILQEFERLWRALRLCSSESAQEECDPGKKRQQR